MRKCRVCRSEHLTPAMDAGLQPISNRYVRTPKERENLFPLTWDLCGDCGMLQLAGLIPPEELQPRFDWITYNEPEDHLDAMVAMLGGLAGMSAQKKILGISFKDDTTLRRLGHKGFKNTYRLDPLKDLGITCPGAGAETLQLRIEPQRLRAFAQSHGRSDMVIVRHILEHAHDPAAFLDGLKELVNPGGYLVIEVPDCSRAIRRQDYTTLWEEHVLYFSPVTFQRCLREAGFSLKQFCIYPYAFEDSLVGVVQAAPGSAAERGGPDSQAMADVRRFADGFKDHGAAVRLAFERMRREHGRIAALGAGHLASSYINFFGLGPLIECVMDDDPHKEGLFMPGSRLPILPFRTWPENNIKVCALMINPMSEDKVLSRYASFNDQGGMFVSIFPESRQALKI